MAELGCKPRLSTSTFGALSKMEDIAYTSKSCFAFKSQTPPWSLSRKRSGQGGPGRGQAGSSARRSGLGLDGKSGGLRSVEFEVSEDYPTGWTQAGKGSSEKGQLQPGLALLCPLQQSYLGCQSACPASVPAGLLLGRARGRTIPASGAASC